MAKVRHLDKTCCFRPDATEVVAKMITRSAEAVQGLTADSLPLLSDAQLTSDANHRHSYYVTAVFVREVAEHGRSDAAATATTINFDTNSNDEIDSEALMGVGA